MEIERKYLVRELPGDLDSYPHTEIEQGYLCTSPTLRIRRMGDVFILTVKEHIVGSSTAIQNREEEFSMLRDSYERLKTKCDGNLVSKTRYRISLADGLTAELDIFHGVHQGLRIVEVEFPSVEAADTFTPPAWFGEDVSTDPRYRNSWLAHNS
ncbi:MAG: CYTH domain-containing protein [Bacteroidales bacterium]|nr:CYTH domain-containing protein [Bacteroidales bacterium]